VRPCAEPAHKFYHVQSTPKRSIDLSYDAVRARIEAKRRCNTPETHAEYQPPKEWGELTVSESLDPKDILHYRTCGLCAGLLDIEGAK
jgi:hypothetical protein